MDNDTPHRSDPTIDPSSGYRPTESSSGGDRTGTAGQPFGGTYADEAAPRPTVTPPRGPSVGTVILGLVCLAVSALVIAYQVNDFTLDWDVAAPGVIVGVGLVLVLVGLLGLLRRRPEEPGD